MIASPPKENVNEEFDLERLQLSMINPRHTCTARVTVCVYVSVCLSVTVLVLQATRWLMSNINIFSATTAKKRNENLPETAVFRSYGMKHEQKIQYSSDQWLTQTIVHPEKQIIEA